LIALNALLEGVFDPVLNVFDGTAVLADAQTPVEKATPFIRRRVVHHPVIEREWGVFGDEPPHRCS
jgi:hypothetical protein